MNNRRTVILVTVSALALVGVLLAATGVWAGPDERGLAAPLAPAAVVSDTISYQGRLLDNSDNPVDGTRTMTFSLYAQATGGTPLWSQSGSIAVDDGLLNVNLDVDRTLFDGGALWLGVQVAGDAQEMTPRQPLLPAPYALSLRPEAIISGTANNPILSVVNTGSSHALWGGGYFTYAAIYGENYGAGYGVRGDSASGMGVYGLGALVGVRGDSTNGLGVAGFSDNDCGVYGQSVNAPAGYFTSTNSIGLHANTLSTDPKDAAVLGENFGAGRGVAGYSGHEVAVYGQSANGPAGYFTSTNSIGVEAWSFSDIGVEGHSTDSAAGFFASTHGPAGVFTSTYDYAVRVDYAGLDGLRILDAARDYIRAGSDANPDFRVQSDGMVLTDRGYRCGDGAPGCLQTGSADVAERVNASGELEPGDVVEIDPTRSDHFRLARTPYSTLVAGVISSDPAIVMGTQGISVAGEGTEDERPPLALVGRVRVKASAENGAIRPGDLLVASSMPGHAMRADNPPPGTILGKALEPLDVGTGVILVLVMLQ